MKNFVLGITGASAQPLAERAIKLLLQKEHHIHLIISKGAYEVWKSELQTILPVDTNLQETFFRKRLDEYRGKLKCYKWNNNSADIASGSFKTDGMIILPCTMGTLGRIASGISINLIERCADVHLKENRPLILSPRESPLNMIHLRNMKTLCEAGATICPPMPAWYSKPKTIDDIIDFIVIRLFDSLGEDIGVLNRWDGK